MTNRGARGGIAAAAAVLQVVVVSAFGQGSLTPTGGPSPTMKSLAEIYVAADVARAAALNAAIAAAAASNAARTAATAAIAAEPRTALGTENTPGNTSWFYRVVAPGSYFLAQDTLVTNKGGISIEAANVTVDLRGFALRGDGSGSHNGIYVNILTNVEIRNGTICDFGGMGIDSDYATHHLGHRLLDLRVLANGQGGISLGCPGVLVRNCQVVTNGGIGISVGEYALVAGNTVVRNRSDGISASDGSTVIDNTVGENGLYGLHIGAGSVAMRNTCRYNAGAGIGTGYSCLIKDNSVSYSGHSGIQTSHRCLVRDNSVTYNNQDAGADNAGIYLPSGGLVANNNLQENNVQAIYVYNVGNLIQDNFIGGSGYGIYFNSTNSCYAGNRFTGNSTNVFNAAGQTNGGSNVYF